MHIVNYDWICHTCGKVFNWNEDSWQYGQIDKPEEALVFCSTDCKNKHKERNDTTRKD